MSMAITYGDPSPYDIIPEVYDCLTFTSPLDLKGTQDLPLCSLLRILYVSFMADMDIFQPVFLASVADDWR